MSSDFVRSVCRPWWFRLVVAILFVAMILTALPQTGLGAFAAGRFPGGPVEKIDNECKRLSSGNYYAKIGDPRGGGLMAGPNTKEYKFKGALKTGNNMIGEVAQIKLCKVKRGKRIKIKYAEPFLKYRGKSSA